MPENLAPWLLSFLVRLMNTHTNSTTDLLKTCLHNLQSYHLLLQSLQYLLTSVQSRSPWERTRDFNSRAGSSPCSHIATSIYF